MERWDVRHSEYSILVWETTEDARKLFQDMKCLQEIGCRICHTCSESGTASLGDGTIVSHPNHGPQKIMSGHNRSTCVVDL